MNDRMRRLRLALLPALAAIALSSAPAPAAECAGDECQGPAPAPAEVLPGTAVVEGPENPPVHFPESHHPKKPGAGKHHKPPSHQRAPR